MTGLKWFFSFQQNSISLFIEYVNLIKTLYLVVNGFIFKVIKHHLLPAFFDLPAFLLHNTTICLHSIILNCGSFWSIIISMPCQPRALLLRVHQHSCRPAYAHWFSCRVHVYLPVVSTTCCHPVVFSWPLCVAFQKILGYVQQIRLPSVEWMMDRGVV